MMSDELKQVDVRLKLVEGNGVYSDKPITNPQEAISVMADVMAGLDREEVCVINLDSKGHPINFNVVSIGTLNSSFVSGRELFKSAILSNAASMILLHNHPSSELQMSQSDRMVTEKMMYASLFLDIEILDHIIVAGRTGDTLSIRETYPEIFDKSTYVNAIVRVADGVEERENSYDAEGLATYELFQIKEGGNGQAYQFMGMDFVKKNKLVVDKYNQSDGVATWVYVDEMHELWGEEYSLHALEKMWREVRKRGGICTGMSQNLIDAQRNRSTKTMVSNSEFMLLLDQGTMDKEAVEDLFDISAEQLACVNGADPGMGLIRFGDKIVPFDNTMKKDSELYQLFNTNFHEIAGATR